MDDTLIEQAVGTSTETVEQVSQPTETAAFDAGTVAPVETQVSAPAPQQPTQADFLSSARQYLGANWNSPDEAIRDIAALQQEYKKASQLASYAQQVLPYQSEFQKFLDSQKPKQAEPEVPKYRHGLNPTQVSKAMREFGEYNDQLGRYVARVDAPAWARDHIEKYQEWFDTHRSNLFSDRADDYIEQMGFIRANQLDKIKEEIRNEFRNEFSSREATVKAQRHFQEIAPRVFQTGSDGQMVHDPMGRPVYTEWGRAFHQAVNELESMGITDPQKVRRYAEAVASQNDYARQAATQQIETAQRRAAGVPPQIASPATRSPASVRAETPPAPNARLGDLLRDSGFGEADLQDFKRDMGLV